MNIVYNASAGTGKTYQVTGLYEKLVLEEGIDPRKILLMTFTENAAAELRMRVAHRLLKARRTAEAEDNDELTERTIAAMAHLPSAPIGTIHSFCTRLLREHALEAGLSPGFSVLVGDEQKELLDQICRDELLARLGADPDFKTFCSGAHIIGTGGGFGTSITETVPNLIAQAGSLGISLENAEAMLPGPVPSATRVEFEMICQRINELPKITPAVQTALDIIQQALQETADIEALVDKLEELGIKKFGRGGAKEISDDFWALKESVKDAVRYRERFPAAQAFARYVQAGASQFQQRKHEMDAVDFDDQLHMAAELLQSGRAKPDFEYVIVDEVQDTSRIQCDLIQSLWGEETNLIICGDKKQSIYTWRGADPQVMPDLENQILKAGGKPENLQTSYRSKAPILDVVNTLFEAVYGQEDYTPSDCLAPNPDFETDGEKPCIEFLSFDGDEELSKQDKTAAEMEAVANRIQLLVNGSSEWKPAFRHADNFQPTDDDNAYRYSDILILLRRTTHQSALEQALRHAGVPYTLGGKGRGLFSRQETRDVSLFLNVVANPNDAYSLIGFLRSPWVGLSDEAIAELAWSDEGFSIDRLQVNYPTATDVVDRYRALLGTKLASELVRMLIDETGYDALLAGLPRGTQRLANLRKVLDWLRETERGAQTTPGTVARKLAEQIANPPQVPEAALLDPAQNAVTIMTVHGSKGLTKRVVFVPDTSFSGDSDRGFARVFFDEPAVVGGGGDPASAEKVPMLGVKITAPDKSSVASPGFKAANERASAVRKHELKNLFYVAMTRARDLVVTSATVGKRSGGWLKNLEPLFDKEIPTLAYSDLSEAVERVEPAEHARPTANGLAQAMDSLPPAPAKPTLQRMPATRLAKEQDELESAHDDFSTHVRSVENATALGSLGHAVLEQLALNGWEGSVAEWLEQLRDEFDIPKKQSLALKNRIEQTRELMMGLTTDMQEIRPEFPFVLHEEDKLIDGTVDLLCRTADGFAIFDYKFTEAADAVTATQYRRQMEIYRKAAEKLYPYAAEAKIWLVAVSSSKPRLIPIDF
ncbi:UvrD-helicase domain-containing protein [Pontiella sulfatireligans]|uniref:DNA 3'-5' helicase n=1 Tax=Pontiella sulfatireligans TaxID=2750658 RepID=A0A6C2ULR5_9BACT|nr:UvrD-helicase domain-containing protein [Pontiella sulfatireligans]VGO21058.1 ATP-dependent helicase/nuclease subunit A [Pontiella sulfatireligans]